mgnify:CR=1 FL=1
MQTSSRQNQPNMTGVDTASYTAASPCCWQSPQPHFPYLEMEGLNYWLPIYWAIRQYVEKARDFTAILDWNLACFLYICAYGK